MARPSPAPPSRWARTKRTAPDSPSLTPARAVVALAVLAAAVRVCASFASRPGAGWAPADGSDDSVYLFVGECEGECGLLCRQLGHGRGRRVGQFAHRRPARPCRRALSPRPVLSAHQAA